MNAPIALALIGLVWAAPHERARRLVRHRVRTVATGVPRSDPDRPVPLWLVRMTAKRPGQRRRLREARRALAEELVRQVATDVAAGAEPTEALTEAVQSVLTTGAPVEDSPARAEVLALHRGLSAGLDPARVLASSPDHLVRGLGVCWAVTTSAGAPLAPTLERLGAASRAEASARRAADAALAGPRATIRVLALLPFAGVALSGSIGAHPVQFLFGSPAGFGVLVLGLLFEAAGVAWTRRIVARADPASRRPTQGRGSP